jgi:hypothetical protein
MMQNPEIMRMATQMMSNPAMSSMMQNMMKGGNGQGGMPDLSTLMQNPEVANMAAEMMKDPAQMAGIMENPGNFI